MRPRNSYSDMTEIPMWDKSLLWQCRAFWCRQPLLVKMKNHLLLRELSSIWGRSTGWSHTVGILQGTPLLIHLLFTPTPPYLPSFLPIGNAPPCLHTDLTELNMTIICIVFCYFPQSVLFTRRCSVTGLCKWSSFVTPCTKGLLWFNMLHLWASWLIYCSH